MDAALYIEILRGFLLQFIEEKFQGSGYRFMQDNDLKHMSKKAKNFMSNSESIGGPPQRTVQTLTLLNECEGNSNTTVLSV